MVLKNRTKGRRQSFIYGALILTVGMAAVKVIGALFKIPLKFVIGEYGMGLFNVAYNFYAPVFSLATAGFPIAVSRLVSESSSLGHWNDVRAAKKAAMPLFLGFGAVGCLLMTALAPAYCERVIGNSYALYPMLALAPAILFSCAASVYRGYYEGLRDMKPTAISQIAEALVKLVIGLSLTYAVMQLGASEYAARGTVFGTTPASEDDAVFLTLAFAAAGAILGVTIGSAVSLLCLVLRHRVKGDGISLQMYRKAPPARGRTIKRLLSITLPVAAGSLAVNAAGLIDATFLQSRLNAVMQSFPERLLRVYEGMIPEVYLQNPETVPTFLYGCYTLALTIYLLVPAITQAFGISALPAVTEAWTKGDKLQLKDRMESVLRVTALFSFPAGLGITALAQPITELLYGSGESSHIVAQVLMILGPASLVTAMSTPLSSMLQAAGRADIPVKLLCAAMLIKVIVNRLLCGIPEINIMGAGVGTFLCYLFLTVAQLAALRRITGIKLSPIRLFSKPFICAVLCGGGALLCFTLLQKLDISGLHTLKTLASVCFGGLIYVFSLLFSRGISKKDILSMPKGQKIAKTLEKRGWL